MARNVKIKTSWSSETPGQVEEPTKKRRYTPDPVSDSEENSSSIFQIVKRQKVSRDNPTIQHSTQPNDDNTIIGCQDFLGASNKRNRLSHLNSFTSTNRCRSIADDSGDSIDPSQASTSRSSSVMSGMSPQRSEAEITPSSNYDFPTPDDPNHMSVQDRKRYALYEYLPKRVQILKTWMNQYLDSMPKDKGENDCWIYSGPRLPSLNRIQYLFQFRYKDRIHHCLFHYGIIALIVEGRLTDEEKEGIIEERWHASHLCGNWPCCNPRHIQPEPGSVNISRNRCFARLQGPCKHNPPCLKTLKLDPSKFRTPPPARDPTSYTLSQDSSTANTGKEDTNV